MINDKGIKGIHTFNTWNSAGGIVNINVLTSQTLTVDFGGTGIDGFYITHFYQNVMGTDAGSGLYYAIDEPELVSYTNIYASSLRPLGDSYSLPGGQTRAYANVRAGIDFDWSKSPLYIPGTDLVIRTYYMLKGFAPVGVLRVYTSVIFSIGFQSDKTELNPAFNYVQPI